MQRLKLVFFAYLLSVVGLVSAQQDIHFTQSMFNRVYLNPGVAGSEGVACVSAFHRSQWVGFEGAPVTQNVNFHMPVAKLKGGVGLSLVNDKLGFEQNNEFKISYAYSKIVGPGVLGIGISAGMQFKGYNNPDWVTPDASNASLDDAIPVNGEKANAPNVGVGLYYNTGRWFTGLSVLNGLDPSLKLNQARTYQFERHYYVMGGYMYELNRDISVEPYLLLKTDISSFFQFDLAVRGIYDNRYWVGLAYRMQDAASMMLGMRLNDKLKFGYSYDLSLSSLRKVNSGGHEIMVSYCFVIEKKSKGNGRERYRNIRFL